MQNSKGNVVIVEALSTGFNFVQDCIDRDYTPVILELHIREKEAYEFIAQARQMTYQRLRTEVIILREASSYEVTLEKIRDLQPAAIVPGCEQGVSLATRLAESLGLPGNPTSIIDRMNNKYIMHQALKDAGVRYIRGKLVDTYEDALDYYDSLDNKEVVVKPTTGSGSMGVRFCNNREEYLQTLHEQADRVNIMDARASELLIQERIHGKEYIVNTVTVAGRHLVSSIWKYEKKELENGSNVYVGMIAMDEITSENYTLVKYAFSVLDAIGIRQGPVHGEYMMDEKGPVLIEINCRCMGGSYPISYGNTIFGHHETDIALDSYLKPDKAIGILSRPYRTYKHALEKDMITPRDMSIRNSPIIKLLPYLKSFYASSIKTSATEKRLVKTVDLETETGVIYMCHEDLSVLESEYHLLNALESKYFGLLYQEDYDSSLASILQEVPEENSLDEAVLDIKNLRDYPLEDVYQYLKELIRAMKRGALLRITKEACTGFPYEEYGMIMVLRIMGLQIQLPKYGNEDMFARKI